ncbi:uncharacterized protein AC631_05066 [Debaryomyces fabryi]|uniref:Hyaluronan/mRNA-binding protein domain-containing protein n=1 Tax=Debaryomyces fabryi TaxID=58627 RepID=A0A0V1PSQ7_9ASCO|nr:uncharacterized protein AC631_05066 [Debaryomyces fabryi]KRZ99185.1 hypothetical protein AC631_05066 [Debaryomyces fabryi]CUM48528.1 unnamed protein product [Debaryomyces fabryi]
MSFENKNLYHLLGNDVEDDSTPKLPIREVVKNTTSSKKSDVPPPSADPAKAKKKSKATGNEGAFKNKPDNKNVSAPSATPSKHYKKPFDRHSRSNKSDGKKFKEGEKREFEAEVDAVSDAVEELETGDAAAVDEADATPKQSLSDYFAQLQAKQQELDGKKNLRPANAGSEDKWTAAEKIQKEQEAYFAPSVAKKAKAKAAKEKKFLDIEASFADQTANSRPSESRRGGSERGGFNKRGGKRGGERGGFNGKKPAPSSSAKKPAVNDKNFPSL